MAVFVDGEQSYLLAPPGRGRELARGLGTYLLLSRCAADPVAAAGMLAVLGARWREAVAAAGGTTPSENGWIAAPGVLWFGRTLLGVPGAVAVAQDPERLAALRGALEATGTPPVSEGAVEVARIRVGWPAWGAELTETVLPPEVGIEGETVSYSKGCYVGQETLARMRTYGHPTQGLAGLRQLPGSGDKPALPVPLAEVGEAKTRGSLTSWGLHPEHGGVGLALVRRELTQPGTRLAGDGREFEVTPLRCGEAWLPPRPNPLLPREPFPAPRNQRRARPAIAPHTRRKVSVGPARRAGCLLRFKIDDGAPGGRAPRKTEGFCGAGTPCRLSLALQDQRRRARRSRPTHDGRFLWGRHAVPAVSCPPRSTTARPAVAPHINPRVATQANRTNGSPASESLNPAELDSPGCSARPQTLLHSCGGCARRSLAAKRVDDRSRCGPGGRSIASSR